MNRRDFFRVAGAASASFAFSRSTRAASARGDNWRAFEITTDVEVVHPIGRTRAWLPVPLSVEPYQKRLRQVFRADGGSARFVEQPAFATGIVSAEWPEGVKPVLSMTARVRTRDYAVNVSQPPSSATSAVDRVSLQRFLEPSAYIPIDGIVKETATAITRGARTGLEKARAIYDWIVENTFRDPKTRGCGLGDIRFMLESKNLSGKCADLNSLFVGLARASGLPARDAYGVRVAPSRQGFKSLGASTTTITKSQHCRAEVFLGGYGWVPVDPADVRKVVLEEPPGNLAMNDDAVRRARTRLFGAWEMNWVAFNFGSDVELPGSTRGKLPFFMYPQAETADGRVDSLDPDAFKYRITAREIASA
jgi:transglutaminase-like putative cysteine protease